MIRFILVVLTVLLYLILGIPVLLAEWVVGRISPRARDISCLRMVQAAFKLILWLTGAQIEYIGRENVPKDQAVLYVGNHNSYFDILLTYSQCPDLTGYVAKAEMLRYPLLRDWMKRLYCLFLDRDDIRAGMQTILKGIEYIKNGISICIFPEGTRSKDGKMLPFKEGSMKMASKSGCPIVPMAISGSAGIWEAQFPKMKPCRVIVEYGAPIFPKELSREEQKFLGAYTQRRIQEMLDAHSL
ncbi:MAG: lysophospholipid acyltransferase family protein [Eubacteriales bacterium]|nr:lysophospholipid acyltransferase family protein [Eubacteriales bacterium]